VVPGGERAPRGERISVVVGTEDDVIDNNLRALQTAAPLVETMRGIPAEQLSEEALLVLSIVTALDVALFVYTKRTRDLPQS